MQLINQLGIANNTLIIFTSDNGAALVSRQKGMPIKSHVLHKKVFHKIYRLLIRVIKVIQIIDKISDFLCALEFNDYLDKQFPKNFDVFFD